MSITLEFLSNNVEVNPFARFSWTRGAVAWADEIGPIVRDALKEEAPVAKTSPITGAVGGRLRDSIRYERQTALGTVGAVFTANTPYAQYVVDGTGPHVIAASAARALQFEMDGAVTYRKQVNHPGTKPNLFAIKAVTPLILVLADKYNEAMQASAEGA